MLILLKRIVILLSIGEDPQSILNRAAFQGDLIQVENILIIKKRLKESLELDLVNLSIPGGYLLLNSLVAVTQSSDVVIV